MAAPMTTVSATQNPAELSIEITSDTVCPFCYIGYKRIQRAIALTNAQPLRTGPINFKLHFVPFQLDGTIPPYPGIDRREKYFAKFGQANFERMEKSIGERGKEEGLDIKFRGQLSNTLDSHRVLNKAYDVKGWEGQKIVAEILFTKFFEESQDQADPEILSDALEKAGVMSKEKAKKFIASDELAERTQEEFLRGQEKGITGVPYFAIDGKYAVSGAQDVSTFVNLFKALTGNQEADKDIADGERCG